MSLLSADSDFSHGSSYLRISAMEYRYTVYSYFTPEFRPCRYAILCNTNPIHSNVNRSTNQIGLAMSLKDSS